MPILTELLDDNTATGNPSAPSDRQRRRQAVLQAAEKLAVIQHAGNRLTKALQLVLANAVTINPDGTAQVRSGNRTYTIARIDGCMCEDSKRRTRFCKHYLAMLISKRATALLQEIGHARGQEIPKGNTASTEDGSAAWQVHEAPVACTLTFTCKGVDIHLTLRDISDDALFARVKRILPRIQEKMQTPPKKEM